MQKRCIEAKKSLIFSKSLCGKTNYIRRRDRKYTQNDLEKINDFFASMHLFSNILLRLLRNLISLYIARISYYRGIVRDLLAPPYRSLRLTALPSLLVRLSLLYLRRLLPTSLPYRPLLSTPCDLCSACLLPTVHLGNTALQELYINLSILNYKGLEFRTTIFF